LVGEKASQGVIIAFGQGYAQVGAQVADAGLPGGQGHSRGQIHEGGLFFVVFIVDVPHDLFNYVLHGHQAGRAAVFVQHYGQVALSIAEFRQYIHDFFVARHQGYGADNALGQGKVEVVAPELQKVLAYYEAHYVVQVAVKDRQPRVTLVEDCFYGFAQGAGFFKAHHGDAGGHYLAGHSIVEVDYALDHLAGALAYGPAFLAVIQKIVYFRLE